MLKKRRTSDPSERMTLDQLISKCVPHIDPAQPVQRPSEPDHLVGGIGHREINFEPLLIGDPGLSKFEEDLIKRVDEETKIRFANIIDSVLKDGEHGLPAQSCMDLAMELASIYGDIYQENLYERP